jgi:transcriptional regulator with XRE-family HTH domain
MVKSINKDTFPLDCTSALKRLGSAIRVARLRRSLPLAEVAKRCMVTAPTLRKVERGDPSVNLGAVVTVLWLFGMQERLATLLDHDPVGEGLESRRRPSRARPHIEELF